MKLGIFATLAAIMMISMSFSLNTNTVKENNVTTEAYRNVVAAAKAAIRSCPDAKGKLEYDVRVVSSCFAGGFITEVFFYKPTPCPPNQICAQVIVEVGTVEVGCDGNVTRITCGRVAQ